MEESESIELNKVFRELDLHSTSTPSGRRYCPLSALRDEAVVSIDFR